MCLAGEEKVAVVADQEQLAIARADAEARRRAQATTAEEQQPPSSGKAELPVVTINSSHSGSPATGKVARVSAVAVTVNSSLAFAPVTLVFDNLKWVQLVIHAVHAVCMPRSQTSSCSIDFYIAVSLAVLAFRPSCAVPQGNGTATPLQQA